MAGIRKKVFSAIYYIHVCRSEHSFERFDSSVTQIMTTYQNFRKTEVQFVWCSPSLSVTHRKLSMSGQHLFFTIRKMEIPLEIKLQNLEIDQEKQENLI